MSAIDVLRSDHVAKTRERARLAARVEELDRELAELVDALELFGVDIEAEAAEKVAEREAARKLAEEAEAEAARLEAEARAEAEARQAAANAPPDPPHEVPIVPATPTELEPAE